MRDVLESWAVVLAGGEGSRLARLTKTSAGVVVPKQFCSLSKSSCLLQDALLRARAVAMSSQVCTVVSAQHRRWWVEALRGTPEPNVFVQPRNRGTGIGILLALLKLEARNPDARVTFLPADHYFRDEATIVRTLRLAVTMARANPDMVYLLGAKPDCADTELGYIVPAHANRGLPAAVARFAEKPSLEDARRLVAQGALWNLFILVGSAKSVLSLFAERYAGCVSAMRAALAEDRGDSGEGSLAALYEELEPIDFSHDVLQRQIPRLQVMRVPSCGWTDLGTPRRVAATVRSLAAQSPARRERPQAMPLFLDLGGLHTACDGIAEHAP